MFNKGEANIDPNIPNLQQSMKEALASSIKKKYAESHWKLRDYDPKHPPDFNGGQISRRSRQSSLREMDTELSRKFTNPFKLQIQQKIEKYQMNMQTNDRATSFRDKK